ncbi:DUF4468 domain-containing protein [Chitinophagaceae bacterium MMS25-I14]
MKKKLPLILAAFCAGVVFTSPVSAQEKNTAAYQSAENITIGSKVLKQKGESEYAYNNEPYFYEKVWEVPNTVKAEIFNRAKRWISHPVQASVRDLDMDETDNNSIIAVVTLELKDIYGIKDQKVKFKMAFAFKDNKLRLQVSDFLYTAYYDYGVSSSSGYLGNTHYTDVKNNSGEYKMQFNNLRPITKKTMKAIYEDFDAAYLVLIRSMKKAVISNGDNNW